MTPDLETLCRLFYPSSREVGEFTAVAGEAMPGAHARLLAHDEHMTATVEAFWREPVDVRVLAKRRDGSHYAREITLARRSDGRVVQFGVMRVNFELLESEVRREIESESTPLGRILIERNVLRRVQLCQPWRIVMANALAARLEAKPGETTYGRTAFIECNGAPAIELLEIVAPLADSADSASGFKHG